MSAEHRGRDRDRGEMFLSRIGERCGGLSRIGERCGGIGERCFCRG